MGSFKPDHANQHTMRHHVRVSKSKAKHFSSRKPQRGTPSRNKSNQKNRTYKTIASICQTSVCTDSTPAGLIDVHRLIDSTALAGEELLANNGHIVQSVVAHVTSTILTNDQHIPDVKQSIPEYQNQSCLLSLHKNIHSNNHHPFLHSWEYDDHYVTSRRWRSRRNTYLGLRLIHSDVVDSSDQENLSDDCALSSLRLKTRVASSKPTSRISTATYRRSWIQRPQFPSPLPLYERGADHAISLELEAQRKLLSSLEPCVLGFRWPTFVIDEGKVNVASKLSPMMDRETMVLWR